MARDTNEIEVGTVVRDRKWDGRYTGTVVRREDRSIFVAWHGSFVEDEFRPDEVEVWADAPDGLRDWQGGIGIMRRDGTVDVEGVADRRPQ